MTAVQRAVDATGVRIAPINEVVTHGRKGVATARHYSVSGAPVHEKWAFARKIPMTVTSVTVVFFGSTFARITLRGVRVRPDGRPTADRISDSPALVHFAPTWAQPLTEFDPSAAGGERSDSPNGSDLGGGS
jgi:hypothetical protein